MSKLKSKCEVPSLQAVIEWALANHLDVRFLALEFGAVACRFESFLNPDICHYEVVGEDLETLLLEVRFRHAHIFSSLKMRPLKARCKK